MSELPSAAVFHYRARGEDGASVAGELQATSLRAALAQLQQRGMTVLELAPGGAGAAGAGGAGRARSVSIGRGRHISLQDRMLLLQELSTLLGAGISIGEALPSLEAAYRGTPLGEPCARMRQAVQGGQPVVAAFRSSGLGLAEHSLSLIESGDASGRLAAALGSAGEQLEYEHGMRQQLRNALVYPAVLVAAGAVAVLIIFIAVVPRFASLIRSGRAEVPALSRWVIETGLYLQQNTLVVGLLGAGLAGAVVLALRSAAVREQLLNVAARLPLVGPWLLTSETGRWATLLGMLLEHRVAVLTALALSGRGLRLPRLRAHLAEAEAEVRRGRALSDILASQGWIAPTRLNLIRVGERAGELPAMLRQLGRLQTEAARQQQQRLLTLIEPLAILAIGSVIGVIMVAVVMAVTSVNTAV